MGADFKLLKAGDVAALLQVSKSWVYQRAADGQLPSLKVGGALRFDAEAIRAFVLKPSAGGR